MTIYIIGVGGCTGALFARELQGVAKIVGVGMGREVEAIRAGNIKIERGGNNAEIFNVETILPENFGEAIAQNYPNFIWLAVRNPVRQAVEFYYRNFACKKDIPALILSQNGLSAIGDAKAGLAAALGQDADKVRIIRVSLMNGVDRPAPDIALPFGRGPVCTIDPASRVPAADIARVDDNEATIYSYKLPIKLGFGAAGDRHDADLEKIFWEAKIEYQDFDAAQVFDMENSKLFVNLIGMASAVNNFGVPKASVANGLIVKDGLRDKIVFEKVILKEEIAALKEFVLVVKKSGHGFVGDFCGYPIGLLAKMVLLPAGLLLPFRFIFEKIVNKGRNRTKNTSEIDYYNGEVVKLGKKFNVATPVNENIIAKAKKCKV